MKEEIIKRTKEYAYHMRKNALEMAYAAGSHAVHFGAGMSIIDILAVLYSEYLNLPSETQSSEWDCRDRFILSKGHGVIGYYAALVEKGLIDKREMKRFENDNSFLLGHPVQSIQHGIEFTNGSLGMGLSIGIGVALAARRRLKPIHTYVLMGDGECGEGAVWEAALSASHYKLDNLTAIIDVNGYQLGGRTEDILNTSSLIEKFESFGWKTIEVDGHDHEELIDAFSAAQVSESSVAIIAHTIKGKGFSFSENNNAWHHAVLTEHQYQDALQELEERYGRD
ncbi:MAG: transketolase [Lachnospiraceae bacterium]